MLTSTEMTAVIHELSGKRAQAHIAALSVFDRNPGTLEFRAALEYVKTEFEKAGLRSVRVERFPSRKGRHVLTWPLRDVWQPISAELRLLKPAKNAALLASYPDEAISLSALSAGTPKGGRNYRLVFVGRGESPSDYAGKRVRGNIALLEGAGPLGCLIATARYGAAGVIRYSTAADSLDFPDIAGRDRIVADPRSRVRAFGFSLPRRAFESLKALVMKEADEGRHVEVYARVDTQTGPGTMDVLSGIVPGRGLGSDGEFLFVAHLCHPRPSANDNASGVALCIEMARAMTALIARKKLAPPRANIRFLVCAEWAGSIPWVARHLSQAKRLLGAVSLDMVGEDQAKCGSTLNVHASHSSSPSYLADLICMALADAKQCGGAAFSGFKFAHAPYVGATDNVPFAADPVRIPNAGLVQWPDHFYHSTDDTVDKTSPMSLQVTGVASVATCSAVTNPAIAGTCRLITALGNRVRERLRKAIEAQADALAAGPKQGTRPLSGGRALTAARTSLWTALQTVQHHKTVALDTLQSLFQLAGRLQTPADRQVALSLLHREVARTEEIGFARDLDTAARLGLAAAGTPTSQIFPTATRKPPKSPSATRRLLAPLHPRLDRLCRRAASIVPAWSSRFPQGGPLNKYCLMENLSGARFREFLRLSKSTPSLWIGDEPIYWIDRRRTLLDIWRILCAEGVPSLDKLTVAFRTPAPSELKGIFKYFEILQAVGYLQLRRSRK
ncbi:MAG: DUF4910 domain-containing protein [Planctomycetota bacterium]|nr:DUF4910 domain-containing protein [Planctomycetota bacterium]